MQSLSHIFSSSVLLTFFRVVLLEIRQWHRLFRHLYDSLTRNKAYAGEAHPLRKERHSSCSFANVRWLHASHADIDLIPSKEPALLHTHTFKSCTPPRSCKTTLILANACGQIDDSQQYKVLVRSSYMPTSSCFRFLPTYICIYLDTTPYLRPGIACLYVHHCPAITTLTILSFPYLPFMCTQEPNFWLPSLHVVSAYVQVKH